MVRVIPVRDPTPASLESCVDALETWGFDPDEEESLSHAAHWLRRLGNDRRFLGDLLVERLAQGVAQGGLRSRVVGEPTHVMTLAASDRAGFALRASIWPALDDPALRGNGSAEQGYGGAHDHAADLLVLGYFGPGPAREHFEIDPGAMAGVPGERISVRAGGRMALGEGSVLHYRRRRDVHRLAAPASLSISLSLHHVAAGIAGGDRFAYEPRGGRVLGAIGHQAGEAVLHAAVTLGGAEALDMAQRFGRTHACERVRLSAWTALAARSPDRAGRDSVWRQAEGAGSRLVAGIARRRRQMGEA